MHTCAFKNLFSGRPARRRGRKPATRFSLEQLEPRTLLSVLFTDNFNTDTGGSSGNNGGTIGSPGEPSFTTGGDVGLVPNAGPAGANDTAVQIAYHQSNESGIPWPSMNMQLGTNFGNLSEYYIQYYFKVDPNVTGGMKFLKFFGSTDYPANGNSANTTFGLDYWSDELKGVFYGTGATTTNDTQDGSYYNGTTNNGEPNAVYTADAGGSINIADGNWHLIQVHVKYDTTYAAHDGAYDVWIDGVHVLGVTGLTNRNDANNSIWKYVSWGNYTDTARNYVPADGPFSLWVDDVTISTSFISGTAPAAPTNLTPLPGNNQVTLNWTASSGAYDYNVFRSLTPGGEGSIPVAYGVSGTTWTDANVNNNMSYYYTVTAVNTGGQSSASSEVLAQPVALALNVIGSPAAGTPTFVYSGGTWQLDGSGNINSSTSDNLGFAAESMPANTGGAMIVEINSNSQSTSGDGGGIMWRDGTAQGATNVYVGWSYNGTLVMSNRTTTGGSGATLATVGSITLPVWVKLVCNAAGSNDYTFSGYYSTNGGATWTLLDTTNTIAMSNPMAGLAVANGQSSTADTVAFSNFSTPMGLVMNTIGTPPAGTPTDSYSGGVWTLTGSGTVDANGTASDNAGFAAQNFVANTSSVMYAEITSNSVGTTWFGGGIMFRNGTAQGAANVYLGSAYGEGVWMKQRTTTGGNGTLLAQFSSVTVPVWVALVCTAQGSNNYIFTGYYSTNGTSWTLLGTTGAITMTSPMAGLTVDGGSTADTVTLANVSIGSVPATPAVPSGLVATAGAGVIGLTWNTDSGATAYNIYRSTTSGGEGSTPVATGVTGTSWQDSSITAGTKYYYEITGVNGVSQSGKSGEVSATAIAAPTGLSATVAGNQINLAWTSAAGATTYDVYRGTTQGGENVTPVATGISTTSWADTSITAGTTYYYEVTGVNSTGQGDYSNEAPATAIAAPSGLSVTVGYGEIGLAWTSAVGATTYDVYRGTTAGGEGTTPYATGITGTSWPDLGVTGGTTYYYKVTGVNSSGQGAMSNEAHATAVSLSLSMSTIGSPAAGTPTASYSAGTWTLTSSGNVDTNTADNLGFAAQSVSANTSAVMYAYIASASPSYVNDGGGIMWRDGNTAQGAVNVYLGWTSGGGASGSIYLKERTTANGSGSTVDQSGSITLPRWVELVCTAEGSGSYVFSGYYSTNGLSWTLLGTTGPIAMSSPMAGLTVTNGNTTTADTLTFDDVGIGSALNLPAAPTGLTATVGNGEMDLAWTSAAGASTYNVYRGTTSGGEGATPYATGISTTSWTDTSVTAGTTYYYEVTGVNSSGEGGKSNEASGTAVNLSMNIVGSLPGGTPSLSYSAGIWTLKGSGNIDGIGGSATTDNCAFAAESIPANTSEVMFAEITSSSVNTSWYGGGIMLRDGTAQGAANVFVGWAYDQGVWLLDRTTTNGNGAIMTHVTGISLPTWVEVVCTALGGGNYTFTGYYKTGSTWISLGTTPTISMSSPMAGLTVMNTHGSGNETMTFTNMDPHPLSGSTSALNPISDHWTQPGFADTINFSDSAYLPGLLVNSDDASALSIASVALTPYLPASSTDQDLDALMPGWTADSNNTLNVTGTGSDIGAAFDPFNFASDSVTGDQTIHAEVTN